ncbi:MAG: TetR/AcrR family transcriptional regulator [Candidatus Adiutricales bacterium]|jgi:AcrR family transcriptional regulator
MKEIDTKNQILEATERLLEYYGYQKTSMADIARDCDMSPANIYRFYKGKDEILADIAHNIFRGVETKLRDVVRSPELSASEKLELFLVENLRYIDMVCTCKAKKDEAVEYIKLKKPEIFNRHIDAKRSMIAEILAEGNRREEFDVEDVVGTADLILNATFLCKCQWADRSPPIDEVEKAARGIVRLLFKGLHKR